MSLAVVVVSHGQPDLVRACLGSLQRHPGSEGVEIWVVDSGSPDETPDVVAREFPEARLLRCGNVGFSHANNLALRQTKAAYALLLNPDTEVFEGTLDRCIERLEAEPDIGVVGCKLLLPNGELDHASKRSFPTPLSALAHFTGIGRREGAPGALSQYRATHLGDDEPGDVDAVNGAFMLVRMAAVGEVGLLDEGYWLYMEDLDWCKRFWDRGWRVFYEPAASALHIKGGSSGGRRRVRQEIAFHRGMSRFYRKFEAPRRTALVNAVVYAGIGAKLLLSLAIGSIKRAFARPQNG
jgi:N-acetylglucosaminyl-diphospho-decaprenol L-rhamnosyltransferase